MHYKPNKRQQMITATITSLPIWMGVIIVVLSFVLWHAQRKENIKEIKTVLTVQMRHVRSSVEYAIARHAIVPDKGRLQSLLGGDHYYGISMRVYQDKKVRFKKGLKRPVLYLQWGIKQRFKSSGDIWEIDLWPNNRLLREHKTYLPDFALSMGLLIAVLLMIVGLLAILAAQREKTVRETRWYLSRETKEKQKLQRALQQNQKLQAVGTLAGGVAHDFNNILYAMMGYIVMAREDVEKEGIVYRNLGKVLEAGKRGQKLVSNILSFSRQQQGHDMKKMDLVSMLQHVFELLYPAIPTSIHLIKDIPFEKAIIIGDAQTLEQMMVNVINNAVDAMDGKGDLTVSLSKARFRPAYCIGVTDTGTGMTEETKERLFDPFYTTKAVDKGTGLGLSMAHGIIRDHKGSIHVDTELGKGTVFSIYLPTEDQKGEKDG